MMNIVYQKIFDNTNTNVGHSHVWHEISESVFSSKSLATQVEKLGGNVAMMLNGDDEMTNGSGTTNIEFGSYGIEFFS